jgi:hypothetical protein
VDAVVAFIGVEAAFVDAHPDRGDRVDAQARDARGITTHVRLADQHRAHAERAQVIADRHLADLQRDEVPAHAMRMHVAAGVVAHARGATHRRLHVGVVEQITPAGQGIEVRGVQLGVPVAGQVVRTQLVAHDEEYVLGAACHGQGSGAVSSQWTRANHATAPRPATPWRRGEVHDRGLSRARPVHAGQPPAAVRSGSRHTGDGTGG